jgi:hypothetical protein
VNWHFCQLIRVVTEAPENVRTIFNEMKIEPSRETTGRITDQSRIDRVEDPPKRASCRYRTSRTKLVNGERRLVRRDVNLIVSNMAATLEEVLRGCTEGLRRGD